MTKQTATIEEVPAVLANLTAACSALQSAEEAHAKAIKPLLADRVSAIRKAFAEGYTHSDIKAITYEAHGYDKLTPAHPDYAVLNAKRSALLDTINVLAYGAKHGIAGSLATIRKAKNAAADNPQAGKGGRKKPASTAPSAPVSLDPQEFQTLESVRATLDFLTSDEGAAIREQVADKIAALIVLAQKSAPAKKPAKGKKVDAPILAPVAPLATPMQARH
jgi:hypothetical protein